MQKPNAIKSMKVLRALREFGVLDGGRQRASAYELWKGILTTLSNTSLDA